MPFACALFVCRSPPPRFRTSKHSGSYRDLRHHGVSHGKDERWVVVFGSTTEPHLYGSLVLPCIGVGVAAHPHPPHRSVSYYTTDKQALKFRRDPQLLAFTIGGRAAEFHQTPHAGVFRHVTAKGCCSSLRWTILARIDTSTLGPRVCPRSGARLRGRG